MLKRISRSLVEREVVAQWIRKDWKLREKLKRLYPEGKKEEQLMEFRANQLKNVLAAFLGTGVLISLVCVAGCMGGLKDFGDCVGKISLFGGIFAVLLFYLPESRLEQEEKDRERQMLLEYPELIHKFILLMGAGLSIKGAIGKILEEKESMADKKGGGRDYLYFELKQMHLEMNNGVAETEAFERMGNRIRLLPYMKFSALLSQNLKKGSAELLALLEMEAAEAFADRRETARALGEEASTKMLFPMMLMLILVMAIIIIPAFMQLD